MAKQNRLKFAEFIVDWPKIKMADGETLQHRYEREVQSLAKQRGRDRLPRHTASVSRFHSSVAPSPSSSSSSPGTRIQDEGPADYLRFLDLYCSVAMSSAVPPLTTPLLPSTTSTSVSAALASEPACSSTGPRHSKVSAGPLVAVKPLLRYSDLATPRGQMEYPAASGINSASAARVNRVDDGSASDCDSAVGLMLATSTPRPSKHAAAPKTPAAAARLPSHAHKPGYSCLSAVYPPDHAFNSCSSTTANSDDNSSALVDIERRLRWLDSRLSPRNSAPSTHTNGSSHNAPTATIRCPVNVVQLCYALRVDQSINGPLIPVATTPTPYQATPTCAQDTPTLIAPREHPSTLASFQSSTALQAAVSDRVMDRPPPPSSTPPSPIKATPPSPSPIEATPPAPVYSLWSMLPARCSADKPPISPMTSVELFTRRSLTSGDLLRRSLDAPKLADSDADDCSSMTASLVEDFINNVPQMKNGQDRFTRSRRYQKNLKKRRSSSDPSRSSESRSDLPSSRYSTACSGRDDGNKGSGDKSKLLSKKNKKKEAKKDQIKNNKEKNILPDNCSEAMSPPLADIPDSAIDDNRRPLSPRQLKPLPTLTHGELASSPANGLQSPGSVQTLIREELQRVIRMQQQGVLAMLNAMNAPPGGLQPEVDDHAHLDYAHCPPATEHWSSSSGRPSRVGGGGGGGCRKEVKFASSIGRAERINKKEYKFAIPTNFDDDKDQDVGVVDFPLLTIPDSDDQLHNSQLGGMHEPCFSAQDAPLDTPNSIADLNLRSAKPPRLISSDVIAAYRRSRHRESSRSRSSLDHVASIGNRLLQLDVYDDDDDNDHGSGQLVATPPTKTRRNKLKSNDKQRIKKKPTSKPADLNVEPRPSKPASRLPISDAGQTSDRGSNQLQAVPRPRKLRGCTGDSSTRESVYSNDEDEEEEKEELQIDDEEEGEEVDEEEGLYDDDWCIADPENDVPSTTATFEPREQVVKYTSAKVNGLDKKDEVGSAGSDGLILAKGLYDYILNDASAMKLEDKTSFAAQQLKSSGHRDQPKIARDACVGPDAPPTPEQSLPAKSPLTPPHAIQGHTLVPEIYMELKQSRRDVDDIRCVEEPSKFDENFVNVVDVDAEVVAKLTCQDGNLRQQLQTPQKRPEIIDFSRNVHTRYETTAIADPILAKEMEEYNQRKIKTIELIDNENVFKECWITNAESGGGVRADVKEAIQDRLLRMDSQFKAIDSLSARIRDDFCDAKTVLKSIEHLSVNAAASSPQHQQHRSLDPHHQNSALDTVGPSRSRPHSPCSPSKTLLTINDSLLQETAIEMGEETINMLDNFVMNSDKSQLESKDYQRINKKIANHDKPNTNTMIIKNRVKKPVKKSTRLLVQPFEYRADGTFARRPADPPSRVGAKSIARKPSSRPPAPLPPPPPQRTEFTTRDTSDFMDGVEVPSHRSVDPLAGGQRRGRDISSTTTAAADDYSTISAPSLCPAANRRRLERIYGSRRLPGDSADNRVRRMIEGTINRKPSAAQQPKTYTQRLRDMKLRRIDEEKHQRPVAKKVNYDALSVVKSQIASKQKYIENYMHTRKEQRQVDTGLSHSGQRIHQPLMDDHRTQDLHRRRLVEQDLRAQVEPVGEQEVGGRGGIGGAGAVGGRGFGGRGSGGGGAKEENLNRQVANEQLMSDIDRDLSILQDTDWTIRDSVRKLLYDNQSTEEIDDGDTNFDISELSAASIGVDCRLQHRVTADVAPTAEPTGCQTSSYNDADDADNHYIDWDHIDYLVADEPASSELSYAAKPQ